MEKKMENFLLTVVSVCSEEKPEIVDFSDLYADAPLPDDQLNEMLSLLGSKGFIRLVYFDENEKEVCLQVLPLGIGEAKNIVEKREQEQERRRQEQEQKQKEAEEKARREEEKRLEEERRRLEAESQSVVVNTSSDETVKIEIKEIQKVVSEQKPTVKKSEKKVVTANPQPEQKSDLPVERNSSAPVALPKKKAGEVLVLSKKDIKKTVGVLAFICSLSGSVIGGLIVALLYFLVK